MSSTLRPNPEPSWARNSSARPTVQRQQQARQPPRGREDTPPGRAGVRGERADQRQRDEPDFVASEGDGLTAPERAEPRVVAEQGGEPHGRPGSGNAKPTSETGRGPS